jgi:hypothetical protein
MSMDLDRQLTATCERDWCGCPIVSEITAHRSGCGVSSEVDLTNPLPECICYDSNVAARPECPYCYPRQGV